MHRLLTLTAAAIVLIAVPASAQSPPPPVDVAVPLDEVAIPGAVVPPLIAGQVRAMAHLYAREARRPLVITGGLITSEVIARRIVIGWSNGEAMDKAFPGRRKELAQIRQAVAQAGPELAARIAAAALQIEAQADRGLFLSPHLSGRAIDVRSIDLTDDQVALLLKAASAVGLRARRQNVPPHVHVEYRVEP